MAKNANLKCSIKCIDRGFNVKITIEGSFSCEETKTCNNKDETIADVCKKTIDHDNPQVTINSDTSPSKAEVTCKVE